MQKILKFPKCSKQVNKSSCGANALKNLIKYYFGKNIPERELIKFAGGASAKYGIPVKNILKTAKKYNLKYSVKENLKIKNVIDSIKKGNPVILDIQAWPNRKIKNWENEWEFGHYIIAVGYNEKEGKLIYHDPFDGKRKFLSYKMLNERWHDLDKKRKYNHLGIFFR